MLRAMSRIAPVLAALIAACAAGAGHAQAVDVIPLAAPDAFTTAGRETGLPATLWQGASVEVARTVLPLLAARPVTPAAQQLGRRVLATGAPGPARAGADVALAAARASALSALGDPRGAAAILERAPGLDRSPDLAKAAAESALLAGEDARGCSVAQGLSVSREEAYWLRLRAYCQALAGQTAQAQLTFELAQAQAKDATFARLMAARLNGTPPGAASLRNGLDFALSRSLSLDLAAAKPSPAVGAALAGGDPRPPSWDLSVLDPALAGLAGSVANGGPVAGDGLSALIRAASEADPKTRGRLQAAALLLAALVPTLADDDRARIAAFSTPEGKVPAGRNVALEDAARRGLMGETALLALWTCADAGTAGPAVADRARIVHALLLAGLPAEARGLALEGLLGLK
jgi:hypothetical protein